MEAAGIFIVVVFLILFGSLGVAQLGRRRGDRAAMRSALGAPADDYYLPGHTNQCPAQTGGRCDRFCGYTERQAARARETEFARVAGQIAQHQRAAHRRAEAEPAWVRIAGQITAEHDTHQPGVQVVGCQRCADDVQRAGAELVRRQVRAAEQVRAAQTDLHVSPAGEIDLRVTYPTSTGPE
jgi:hypothetical protein